MSQLDTPPQRRLSFIEPPSKRARYDSLIVDDTEGFPTIDGIDSPDFIPSSPPMPPQTHTTDLVAAVNNDDPMDLRVVIDLDEHGLLRSSIINMKDELDATAFMYSAPSQSSHPLSQSFIQYPFQPSPSLSQPSQSAQQLSQQSDPFHQQAHQMSQTDQSNNQSINQSNNEHFMSDDFIPCSPVLFSSSSSNELATSIKPLDMMNSSQTGNIVTSITPLDIEPVIPQITSADPNHELSTNNETSHDNEMKSDVTDSVLSPAEPVGSSFEYQSSSSSVANIESIVMQDDESVSSPTHVDTQEPRTQPPENTDEHSQQQERSEASFVSDQPVPLMDEQTIVGAPDSTAIPVDSQHTNDNHTDENNLPERSLSQQAQFRTAAGRSISLSLQSVDCAQELLSEIATTSQTELPSAESADHVSDKIINVEMPSSDHPSDVTLSTKILFDDGLKVVVAVGDDEVDDDALSEADTEPVPDKHSTQDISEPLDNVEPALVQAKLAEPVSVLRMNYDEMPPLSRSPTTIDQTSNQPGEESTPADVEMNRDDDAPLDAETLPEDENEEDVAVEEPASPTFSELDFASQAYRMDTDEYEPASQEETVEEAHDEFDLPDDATCHHQATRTTSHTSTCSSRSTNGGNQSDDDLVRIASDRIRDQMRTRITDLENELSSKALALHRAELQLRGAIETKEIMQAENNQLLTQHSQMASQLARAQVQVQRLDEKLMQQALDHQRFKTSVVEENQRIKNELEETKSRERALRDQCKSLEETRASLTSDRDHWASQYQAERQRAAFELTQQVQQFNAAMEQKQAEINAISSSPLHTKMDELNQQITTLTAERAEAIRQKEEAEARAKSNRRELKELKKQVEKDKEQSNNEYVTTQRALQDLALKSVEQKSTLAHLEKDRNDLQAKLRTLEEEKTNFAKQDREMLRLQITYEQVQSNLVRLEAERQELSTTVRTITAEKEQLHQKLREYHDQAQKQRTELTDRITELTRQSAQLGEKASNLQKQLDLLTIRETKAQETIARLQSAGRQIEEEKRTWLAEKFRAESERADKEERIIELKEQVKTLREQRAFISRQTARSPPAFAHPPQYPPYYQHLDQSYSFDQNNSHLAPADHRIISHEQPSPSNSLSNVPSLNQTLSTSSGETHSTADQPHLYHTTSTKPQAVDVDARSTISEPVVSRPPRDVSIRASKRADSADGTSSSRSSPSSKGVTQAAETSVILSNPATPSSITTSSTNGNNKPSAVRAEPERTPMINVNDKPSVSEPVTPKSSTSAHSKASDSEQPGSVTTPAAELVRNKQQSGTAEPVHIEQQVPVAPVILITGFGDQREEIIRIIEKLGGRYEDDGPSEQTTHCLMNNFQATIKSLTCSIKGLWMVERSWLDACEQAGKFVDESEHKGIKFPSDMFKGKTYAIHHECKQAPNIKPGMLQLIESAIRAGGGRTVMFDENKRGDSADYIIVPNSARKKEFDEKGYTCDMFLGSVPFYKVVQASKKAQAAKKDVPLQPVAATPVQNLNVDHVAPAASKTKADDHSKTNESVPMVIEPAVEPKSVETRTRAPPSASKNLSQESAGSDNSRRSSRKREKPQVVELSDDAAFELALKQSMEDDRQRKAGDDVETEPESKRKKQKVTDSSKSATDDDDVLISSSVKSRRRPQNVTTATPKSKLKSKK